MRSTFSIIGLAGICSLIFASSLLSQQTPSFPWRANNTLQNSVPSAPVAYSLRTPLLQEKEAVQEAIEKVTKKATEKAVEAAIEVPPVPKETVPVPQEAIPDASTFDFQNIPDAPSANSDVYQSVVEPQPPLSIEDKAANATETDYCYRDCRRRFECNLGCPKKLLPKIAGFTVGGFSQFGYHSRDIQPFNNRSDALNLQQFWLYGDKTETLRNGLRLHWRIDALYGLDAQEFQAFGNSPTGDPSGFDNEADNGAFGSALPQAFIGVLVNDWEIKFGKFFSPLRYEQAPSTENFFFSRTFTSSFTEPFSHSGVLADNGTQFYGVTAGWDTAFESNNSGFTFLMGRRFQLGRTRLTTLSSLGDTGIVGSGSLFAAIAETSLSNRINHVAKFNFLNVQDVQEVSLVNNLFLTQSECLAFGARFEYWVSDRFVPDDTASTYNFTVGANYRPHANFIFRPEVRWDSGRDAIDDGQTVFGMDMIMTF